MKIAVCDDSGEDRGALRALLEACGYDFEDSNSALCVWKVKGGGYNGTILSRDAGVCYGTAIQNNIKF